MRFAKYEGLGNDFVIVEAPATVSPEEARRICDRHLGVGADGVLLVERRPASMRVLNADGTVARMCGNGLRCVVWHLRRVGVLTSEEVVVETSAGPHRCWLRGDGDVEVEMRAGTLRPEAIPLVADAPLVQAPFLHHEEGTLRVTAVGMGNPHAVTFDPVGDARFDLGPRVQADPRFPEGVNVGFARPLEDGFELHVLERGAGWTQACGTGACAAAVAAVATGRARNGEPVAVHLPGGTLTITVLGDATRMRGPARHVFDGDLP